MADQDINIINKDTLTYPSFPTSSSTDAIQIVNTLFGGADFYRTELNTNIEVTIPRGSLSSGVYTSPDTFLPNSIFNSMKTNAALTFINGVNAKVLKNAYFTHDILIQYKLTQADDNNFTNQRNINTTLVKGDGVTMYDNSITTNNQPDTGAHDIIILKGFILHIVDDIIKIKFVVTQDTSFTGATDTKMTIFKISWNISSAIVETI